MWIYLIIEPLRIDSRTTCQISPCTNLYLETNPGPGIWIHATLMNWISGGIESCYLGKQKAESVLLHCYMMMMIFRLVNNGCKATVSQYLGSIRVTYKWYLSSGTYWINKKATFQCFLYFSFHYTFSHIFGILATIYILCWMSCSSKSKHTNQLCSISKCDSNSLLNEVTC